MPVFATKRRKTKPRPPNSVLFWADIRQYVGREGGPQYKNIILYAKSEKELRKKLTEKIECPFDTSCQIRTRDGKYREYCFRLDAHRHPDGSKCTGSEGIDEVMK